ncbi:MAG: hypothetical protein ISS94_03145 [Candidatus Syntrophoarchaeum sp.]|nr:hypothetical protein [Candidatus Syntrophoarchaeum sp.]
MNKNMETKTCTWCGASLSPNHTGPCPECGKEGTLTNLKLTMTMKFKDALNSETRREFFEKNPKIKWVLYAVTFGPPILGLVLTGLVGLVIGFIFGFISYLLGPYAVIKVREIEH